MARGKRARRAPKVRTGACIGLTAAEEQAPEKIRAARPSLAGPVPKTDTGGRVENTKALERFTVKELGKMAP